MKGTILTPIPGELQSVATDGIVVSADGIYDYQIKKTQELINASIESRLSDVEEKVANGYNPGGGTTPVTPV